MAHNPLGADTPQQFLKDSVTAQYFEILKKRVEKHGAAVADLNQTIAGPTIAEVQAISDKVDELLAVMRAANTIAT